MRSVPPFSSLLPVLALTGIFLIHALPVYAITEFSQDRAAAVQTEQTAQDTAYCCKCQRPGQTNVCVHYTPQEAGGCGGMVASAAFRALAQSTPALAQFTCAPTALTVAQCLPSGAAHLEAECNGEPIDMADLASRLTLPTTPAATTQPTAPPARAEPVTPHLNVAIPGLEFSPVVIDPLEGRIAIPHINQYIAAVYRYLIGLSVIAAIIMVTYGGFRYLTGSVTGDIKRGQDIIQDAIVGMVLVFGAYLILQTINPATTKLQTLQLDYVPTEEEVNAVLPTAPAATTPSTAPATGSGTTFTGPTAAAGTAQGTGTAARVEGAITTVNFSYQPTSDVNWKPNQAQIIFPTRLANQTQSVNVHAFLFIHGHNSSEHDSNDTMYGSNMKTAVREVAGSMNVVVIAPHWMKGPKYPPPDGSSFMPGFTAQNFYDAAVQAMAANPQTRNLHITDVVVGGHSAATCYGQLRTAVTHPLPNQLGIVAFDGCVGYYPDTVRSNFTSAGGAVLINPDMLSMGRIRNAALGVVTGLDMTQVSCPAFVDPGVVCYKNPSNPWWEFRSRFGHEASVLHMTRAAFQYFYASQNVSR